MRGTKKIDWLNHFLEFIVVVIGILLAFQLNKCSENKQEQKLVNNHIKDLVDETSFNIKMLSGSIKNSKDIISLIDSTLYYIDSTTFDLSHAHTKTMRLLRTDFIYLKKNAYNNLVETGDVRFMENQTLQKDIIALYEYYFWLESIDRMTNEEYLNNYMPYATKNFDMVNYTPQDRTVYTNKVFKNYLSVYRYSMKYRLSKQEEFLAYMSKFLKSYSISDQ